MKTVLICGAIAVIIIIACMVINYRRAIKRGRCPLCGAPIKPFANGNKTGYYCTECEWVHYDN